MNNLMEIRSKMPDDDEYWTNAERLALAAGWRPDPYDADQWKHPERPGVAYWDACDIPEEFSV